MGGVGLVLGVLLVLPIGGADMPVVISLLNSYAGLAAAATGFALGNNVLIIAGALDGASGFLLSIMMSKAMNRSFANVLFGAFGTGGGAGRGGRRRGGPADASINQATRRGGRRSCFKAAQSVIVVPGYGMAVSQAQHAVRELAAGPRGDGATVKYAIHPVAGRMPGHMNVLLAEANVPYDQLFDLDDINDEFARDRRGARGRRQRRGEPGGQDEPAEPDLRHAGLQRGAGAHVIVLKRSIEPGLRGIENELFVQPNTMMVLGDARRRCSRSSASSAPDQTAWLDG